MIDRGAGESNALVGAILKVGEKRELRAITFKAKRSIRGAGKMTLDQRYDLTGQLKAAPAQLLVPSTADALIVADDSGQVSYFFQDGDKFELRQSFQPFADSTGSKAIARMDFIFGDVSIVFSGENGQSRVFSLCIPAENNPEQKRIFALTKEFPPLAGPATFFASSQRNKAFLTGSGKQASLRYTTTETIRWEKNLDFDIRQGIIGAKYENLAFLDASNVLHVYELHDPHPEAGFNAFFGKLWYEGLAGPEYSYQSTGGTDEFEPKLSLIPLIWGSIKGTLCALIFAVPIALTAAIYTSQFLDPNLKRIVKPTMEIMASLPSVVLGFLAALWVAPRVADRVPSLLLILVLITLCPLLFGWIWNKIPKIYRLWMRPGWEWSLMLPLLVVLCVIGWNLGPYFEEIAFVYVDPNTGQRYADFGLWWKHTTGGGYDQRNSMVVGFMMGFAVIPIIFTIAEDSLSNVPAGLRSASLALGATRWQTAWEVVLPIASAGIFSALMIGLGRAVGETMIVVMATGNTPLMDFNLFSGMRTLSANIAVELPEAPQFSTHYRVLFLGALLLFLLTFVVNTLAEFLRNHLREKYKGI
ncbi:ABC transporter permease [Verrucomicrobia bacterium LW23]|nr:ABC transporter permease [Verrucomicrobia bacterium LW23]